jgi:hypothetical protein
MHLNKIQYSIHKHKIMIFPINKLSYFVVVKLKCIRVNRRNLKHFTLIYFIILLHYIIQCHFQNI